MDANLRILQRTAIIGDVDDKERYIAALERTLGYSKPEPTIITGKGKNAGYHLLTLLGNRCATANQLARKVSRSSKKVKIHLDQLYALGVLHKKSDITGASVYCAVTTYQKEQHDN